jgi:hypothetical protein
MTSTRARSAAPASSFDPQQHLSRVSGGDYLEVKWRLVWLRDKHPDASIITEMVEATKDFALCKATISIPGGGSATGYGSETPQDFKDHIEKCETKAIGRALGALGFGTQFSGFDFSLANGTSEHVVDAPVKSTTPASQADQAEPLSRADLLARCAQEQARLGAQTVLDWLDEHDKPKKKTEMSDSDLREMIAWAEAQETPEKVSA